MFFFLNPLTYSLHGCLCFYFLVVSPILSTRLFHVWLPVCMFTSLSHSANFSVCLPKACMYVCLFRAWLIVRLSLCLSLYPITILISSPACPRFLSSCPIRSKGSVTQSPISFILLLYYLGLMVELFLYG